MDHPITPSKRPSHHPLLLSAAAAIIVFCLVGIAAILGWVKTPLGERESLTPPVTAPYSGVGQYGSSGTVGSTAAGMAEAPAPAADTRAAYAPPATPVTHNKAAPPKTAQNAAEPRWCSNCGNVESVREITTRARGSGVGAAGGAVLGGLLGHQVGGGHGQDLATVAGAVGGAVIGNQVEGNMKAVKSYQIRVRMDDGSVRVFNQRSAPRWRYGARVRIVNGALHDA